MVFGHTHLPFAREAGSGTALANPGSVGMPFDGDPRAAYAVLHDDGRVEHRRVAYDHLSSAAAVRGALGPAGEVPATRLERASAAGRLKPGFRPLQLLAWPRHAPVACPPRP